MKVYFVGAGPGAGDLITVRGARLLSGVHLVLYAGSLVPMAVLEHCTKATELINTAELNLDEQIEHFIRARNNNWDVVRLHSGDPAIYGATSEQMKRLRQLEIEYEVVPGVSSFSAAAASLQAELTKPDVSQTIILTRVSGRASAVPESESLESLARHRASLCIFLSGPHLASIVDKLAQHYPPETPIALVHRASWPEERKLVSTIGEVLHCTVPAEWALTTMVLVGAVLDEDAGGESSLYSSHYSHRFRRATVEA
jgi:precorrin-4/cobalt-precorrin-4 C11-methyltransferase